MGYEVKVGDTFIYAFHSAESVLPGDEIAVPPAYGFDGCIVKVISRRFVFEVDQTYIHLFCEKIGKFE